MENVDHQLVLRTPHVMSVKILFPRGASVGLRVVDQCAGTTPYSRLRRPTSCHCANLLPKYSYLLRNKYPPVRDP